ncbi:MAG: hypothetical protein SOY45_01755 [Lachnospiraceae bacterium]|nr:hypothetical protein [Lachnospiraceae bacterium]MDY4068597.1 hypothetical protein [Lachnospiraceae bacterium]
MREERVDPEQRQSKIRKCIAVLVGILAVAVGVIVLTECIRVCTKKDSARYMSDLIHRDLKTDILFVGDSQVTADILPMELWQKYGYTSYVLHANNNGIARSRAMLLLALQYSNPKVVVLSTDQYWEESAMEKQVASYHEYADAFPLTKAKIDSTLGWVEDPMLRAEILFPFLIYHNRWQEVSREDFDTSGSVLKGGTLGYDVEPIEFQDAPDTEEAVMPENGERNLAEIEMFIQECQSRDIEVMLLTLPMGLSTKRQSYLYELNGLADQYGIPYLNLVKDHSAFDPKTDFKDMVHMNASGARKLTSYLGQYLGEQYGLQSRMTDPEVSAIWNEDLNRYLELKRQDLKDTQDLKEFLVQCPDENLNVALYVNYASDLYRDDTGCALIRNIAGLEQFDTAREIGEDYFAFVDFGEGRVYESVAPQDEEWNTSVGKICFTYDEGGQPRLSLGDEEQNLFEHKGDGDICVAVFDRWSGQLICTKTFDTQLLLQAETLVAETE